MSAGFGSKSQLVEDCRVDVAKMVGAVDRLEANRVGSADDPAALDTTASHPHREPQIMMIAPLAGFRFRRPAELATPHDERAIKQSTPLEILEQAGDRFIGLRRLAEMVFFDVAVGIPLLVAGPASGHDTNEPDTLLHELPRKQTTPAVIIRRWVPHAVKLKRLARFMGDVEDLGRFRLHLEGEVIGVDPG